MKRIVFFTLGLFLSGIQLNAQEIFPKGEKAANVHHTGDVWLNHLADADEDFDFNVVLATMAPNAKLNWHIHPGGQQLSPEAQVIIRNGGKRCRWCGKVMW